MIDSLNALDTQIENKSEFALTILVGTSILCIPLLVSRDTISLKMVPNETRSNENVLLLPNVSLIIFMLGCFLYSWIALSTGLLIFETLYNESSLTLMLSSFTLLLKKAYSFSAISISDDMMLLLSTNVMVSIVFAFSKKRGLTVFQNFLLSLMFLMLKLL